MLSRVDVNTSSINVTAFEYDDTKSARSRYIWIAVFGMLLNGTAILYLVMDRKTRATLRVTMVGLSLNDLGFNASLVLLGNPRWTLVSDTMNCWITTYIMVTSVIVSYFITIQLSLHNYLAVFYPFHCNVIVTVFRCTLALIASSFFGYLLALACLGLTFEPGLPCYVLVVVPRGGMATACGICLTSSLIIITLNVKVCMKIRRRNREISWEGNARLSHIFSLDSALRKQVIADNFRCQDNSKEGIMEITPDCRNSEGVKSKTPTPSTSKTMTDTISLSISSPHDLITHTSAATNSFLKTTKPRNITNDNVQQNTSLEHCKQTRELKEGKANSDIPNKAVSRNCLLQTAINIHRGKNINTCNIPGSTGLNASGNLFSGRRNRSGTSKTLAIMTWCSCFLTFPLVIELIYGAIWVNDRVEFVKNWFGILVSSLLTAHGVSNPLLYGWRLIAWRNLFNKIKSKVTKCSLLCNK